MRKKSKHWNRVSPFALWLLGGAFVTLYSLGPRWAQMSRELWEDELRHNYSALATAWLPELARNLTAEMQPFLDYLVRKLVWFQLLGFQERDLRVPSLFYSLAAAVLGYVFVASYLANRRHPRIVAWLAGVLAGICVGGNATQIYYAAEARHYSLVALLSIAWCGFYFSHLDELLAGRRWKSFAALSFLFLNTHFFAIVPIAAGYGLLWLPRRKRGEWRGWPLRQAAVVAAMVFVTTIVNYPALRALVGMAGAAQPMSLGTRLATGVEVLQGFWQMLSVPHLFGLLAAAALLLRRSAADRRIVALLFFVIPLFLLKLRWNGQLTIGERYFLPFYGLGVAFIGVGFEAILAQAGRFGRAKEARVLTLALVAVLAIALRFPQSVASTAQTRLAPLPRNFTKLYRAYQELRQTGRPVFVVTSHTYADQIPLMYFEYIGGPYRAGYEVVNSTGFELMPSAFRIPKNKADSIAALARFLTDNPKGTVLLNEDVRRCESQAADGGRELRALSASSGTRIRLLGDGRYCLWAVEGASSVAQIASVATKLGFYSVPGFFQR